MSKVIIKNLLKKYSQDKNNEILTVIENFNLEIDDGKFVAFFGPNGCGKTTLLNCLAGLTKIDSGNIYIDGKSPGEARISYIFQNYRETLLPWFRVIDNIAYPLYLSGYTKKERYKKVYDLLENLNIDIPLNEWPEHLSGGQQQLLVIARALITDPDLMLFDEPFSALDMDTRLQMQIKLQEIWLKTNSTVLFISHEIDEAILLANEVVMLSKSPTKPIEVLEVPFEYLRNHQLLEKDEFFNLRKKALKIFRENRLQ